MEPKRGCGYRKVGALYLVGTGLAESCDRMPYNLTVCPVCGAGIKFSRGFSWVSRKLFGTDCQGDSPCHYSDCPLCIVEGRDDKLGLMWVGKKFYSPSSFIEEAMRLGVSKRIAAVPKDLKLGKTWVLLAHPEAGRKPREEKTGSLFKEWEPCPAIFYAFKPQRIEKLIRKSDATAEEIEKLEKRGITPVVVSDEYDPKKGIFD